MTCEQFDRRVVAAVPVETGRHVGSPHTLSLYRPGCAVDLCAERVTSAWVGGGSPNGSVQRITDSAGIPALLSPRPTSSQGRAVLRQTRRERATPVPRRRRC